MFPPTPFSTPLSGSAKETQTRIRNIFQFQKKRPSVLVLTLAAALVLSCGGLVSCQSAGEDVSTVGRPTIEEPPEVENVSTVAWPMMGNRWRWQNPIGATMETTRETRLWTASQWRTCPPRR